MTLATLFGKLQEHELELSRLTELEEKDKNKKSLDLKASSSNSHDESEDTESEEDEDLDLLFRKLKKFMKNISLSKMNYSSKKSSNKESSSTPPTCYECGKQLAVMPFRLEKYRQQILTDHRLIEKMSF